MIARHSLEIKLNVIIKIPVQLDCVPMQLVHQITRLVLIIYLLADYSKANVLMLFLVDLIVLPQHYNYQIAKMFMMIQNLIH